MTISSSVEQISPTEAIRAALRVRDLGGVLLFEPDNVEFATGYAVRVEANISHADRWALVPASGQAVVWEHPAVIKALRPDAGEGVELRPAVGLDLLGRHGDQHEAFGGEIAAALAAAGCEGLPLAIDELEVSGFLSLRRLGLDLREAAEVLDEARAAVCSGFGAASE
jgi:Xaa-Pro dipeptidase